MYLLVILCFSVSLHVLLYTFFNIFLLSGLPPLFFRSVGFRSEANMVIVLQLSLEIFQLGSTFVDFGADFKVWSLS